MTVGNLHALQSALLDAVAPPNWRQLRIKTLTLTLTAKRLPELTLICDASALTEPDAADLVRRYELVPIDPPAPAEPPPLDLDAMEAAARDRLAVFIDAKTAAAADKIRTAHRACLIRADDRHHARLKWHAKSQVQYVIGRSIAGWTRTIAREIVDGELTSGRKFGRALEDAGLAAAGAAKELRKFVTAASNHIDPGKEKRANSALMVGGFIDPRQHFEVGERGNALPRLLISIAGALAFALALGALGPTLDAMPDQRSEWLQAEQELQQAGALARWEAEARSKCARYGGENAAYIQVQGGGIRCTTKRGHVIAQEGRP